MEGWLALIGATSSFYYGKVQLRNWLTQHSYLEHMMRIIEEEADESY